MTQKNSKKRVVPAKPTGPAAKPAAAVAAKPAPKAEAPKAEPVVVKAEPVKAEPAKIEQPAVETMKVAAAPIETPTKVEPAPAAAVQKGTITMNDTVKKITTETTERAQALFGDINARAKTAMEKGSKMFEEINDLNKGNIEAVVESSKVVAKGAETIGQQAAEYGRRSFENATATMKSFASIKSPTELFQLQSEYVRSAFDSFISETSKNSETVLKLAGEAMQPLSNRFAVAAEKIKTAA